MLSNKELEELAEPIVRIFQEIEQELLIEVATRFKTYDSVSGSLEWYLKKLDELGALNDRAIKIFANYSNKSEKSIKHALENAQLGNFSKKQIDKAFSLGLATMDFKTLSNTPLFKKELNKSINALNDTFTGIKTKALESVKKAYIDVLNKAYIETSSGVFSYSQSIQRAIKQMGANGISGASYKRANGKVVTYSLEATVRRDVLSAIHQVANGNVLAQAKELGTNYIDVSSHLGARTSVDPIANHFGWQGKQYQIEGTSKDYPNFVEATGYGDIQGFGGVNCRHRAFPYFPGVSVPFDKSYLEEENEEVYKATQVQRRLERDVRNLRKQIKCLDVIEGLEEAKKLKSLLKRKLLKLDGHCKSYGLKRDYSRERIG